MLTALDSEYKPTILIVDDTPANLGLLASMLAKKGYQIRVAPSGRLALQFVARNQPDLILLDIIMPDMDGFEVCRRLKENPSWQMIPIIFISGVNDTDGKLRSFGAGGVDYITRPFQCAEVEARVETHIKLRLYQKQLEVEVDKKVRELVAAKEKMLRAEKASILGIMAAGIIHEINQPLNSIKLISSGIVLANAEGKQKPSSEYVARFAEISQQTDRIKAIIEHLRAVSRSDNDQVYPCKLNAAIGKSLQVIGKQLSDHGISILQDLQSDLPDVLATPIGLEEVLVNLLVNSMQALASHSSTHKQIRIRTYLADDVTLEVIDNGPGIMEDLRDNIFEPFISTRNGVANWGLGLAIVDRIISAYHGKIELVSSPENQTVFRIVFPAVSKEE